MALTFQRLDLAAGLTDHQVRGDAQVRVVAHGVVALKSAPKPVRRFRLDGVGTAIHYSREAGSCSAGPMPRRLAQVEARHSSAMAARAFN